MLKQLVLFKTLSAVGTGALHGMGYGDNAKAAVITRGLAEITRLGVKLGADPLTYKAVYLGLVTLLLQELLSIHVTGVLGMRSVVEKTRKH